MKFLYSILLIACFLPIHSQEKEKHKVLVVPFEPKLYMSQVDHRFNAETKMSQKQIKETFRRGVNKELENALKKNYEVLDLLKDTTKYKKDLFAIYKALSYTYDKVPDQNNYKAPTSDKTKSESIKKGQLIVDTDPNARFMNAKILNPNMIPGLYSKYKTDLFLFVNQLDILSTTLATGESGALSERMITLHYTIYSVAAKELQSGVCSVKFPGDVNVPSRILSTYVSKAAAEITRRLGVALAKLKEAEKKK